MFTFFSLKWFTFNTTNCISWQRQTMKTTLEAKTAIYMDKYDNNLYCILVSATHISSTWRVLKIWKIRIKNKYNSAEMVNNIDIKNDSSDTRNKNQKGNNKLKTHLESTYNSVSQSITIMIWKYSFQMYNERIFNPFSVIFIPFSKLCGFPQWKSENIRLTDLIPSAMFQLIINPECFL